MADLRRRKLDNEDAAQSNEDGYSGSEQDINGIYNKLHLKITNASEHVKMQKVSLCIFWLCM